MSLSVPVRLRIRFILYKHFLYHKNNPLALPLVYRTNTRARRGKRGRSVTRQRQCYYNTTYLRAPSGSPRSADAQWGPAHMRTAPRESCAPPVPRKD